MRDFVYFIFKIYCKCVVSLFMWFNEYWI